LGLGENGGERKGRGGRRRVINLSGGPESELSYHFMKKRGKRGKGRRRFSPLFTLIERGERGNCHADRAGRRRRRGGHVEEKGGREARRLIRKQGQRKGGERCLLPFHFPSAHVGKRTERKKPISCEQEGGKEKKGEICRTAGFLNSGRGGGGGEGPDQGGKGGG